MSDRVFLLCFLSALFISGALAWSVDRYSRAIEYQSDSSLRFMDRGVKHGATEFKFERHH